jgi:hypothetical protein
MSNSATDKQQIGGADGGEEFVVERIVSHRFRNGRKEYLLAWKGYSEHENTWVNKFFFFSTKQILRILSL